jgi:tRNA1Val (adenine37-N6)-methyltransferase
VVLNGLSGRVEIFTDAVQNVAGILAAESFDLAVSNPPYRGRDSGRLNPDEQKMHARHETLGDLGDFVKAAAYLLKPGGKAAFVFTASRSAELFSRMAFFRLEPKRVRFIHPRQNQNASMALVEGLKGGRVEMKVLPPLCVYRSARLYTDEVTGILAGGWLSPKPQCP